MGPVPGVAQAGVSLTGDFMRVSRFTLRGV